MLGYLLRRVLAAIPVMGVVALFVFLLLRLTPGDPAAILAGDNATPEQLERIRTSLGLNEPLYTQFFTWIGKLLHGDLGVSLISNVPVLKMIGQRVEPSISIALSTCTPLSPVICSSEITESPNEATSTQRGQFLRCCAASRTK